MEKILLEEMTWYEVEEALESGVETVVVAVGSTEAHGPHMPMATDTLWARTLGESVTQGLGNALLAPVIPVGCTDPLMSFPGTISIRRDVLVGLIVDYCRSLARHGFKNVVLISSHDGDYGPMEDAAIELEALEPNLNVIAYSDLGELVEVIYGTSEEQGIDVAAAGAHAGEFETSLMLAVHPDVVREEKLQTGTVIDLRDAPEILGGDVREAAPIGVIGDPTQATREAGEAYLKNMTEAIVRYVRERGG
jgi:creatinine amidohydrolase